MKMRDMRAEKFGRGAERWNGTREFERQEPYIKVRKASPKEEKGARSGR